MLYMVRLCLTGVRRVQVGLNRVGKGGRGSSEVKRDRGGVMSS